MVKEKKKSKRNWRNIPLIVFMLIPFIWASINFWDYYGIWFSVQFLVVIFATVIMVIFLLARFFNRPNIDNLKLETAKLYFSTTVTVMLAAFASFGIALSILWGNLYTYSLQAAEGAQYINNLKGQGLTLLLFALIASGTVLFSFLIPLIHHINEKETRNCNQKRNSGS